METRTDVLSTDQISIGLTTALTFDDVLLVPGTRPCCRAQSTWGRG